MLASALLSAGCCTTCTTCTTEPAPAPAPVAAAAVNLTGQWHWTCCEGNYSGAMSLQQDGEKITGRLFDQNDTTGGAVAGSVSGNTVKFTRTWGEDFSQDYTLTASADGKNLAGNFDGTQDTQFGSHFEATRE